MTTSPSPTRRAYRRSVQRHLWSRRIRALLASGLVLGVGATVTLAAWNDSEYASGSVTAGYFRLEGSPTGEQESFVDSSDMESSVGSPEMEMQSIAFTPNASLFPGQSTYALFSVRTIAGSLGGTVEANSLGGTNEALDHYLTYGLSVTKSGQCNTLEDFDSGPVIIDRETGLGESPQNSMPVGADGPNTGSQVDYCLELSLADGAGDEAQSQSTTPSWQFLGTSTSVSE